VVISIIVLTAYVAIVAFASEETAKSAGIAYIALLTTVSLFWDLAHRKGD
jgi:hypothetical protein